MAVNYVKFMRGSLAAYNKLTEKDSDTLYFLVDTLTNEGYIYLGTKLISGPESNGITSLKELTDTNISDIISDNSILIYDAQNGEWIDADLDTIIFQGATAERAGLSGVVPAPAVGQQNYFLRGDGIWAPIGSTRSSQVIEVIPHVSESHQQAINRFTQDIILTSGDIAIVKDFIVQTEDEVSKYQYTSYVYNGSQWVAMDGNYDAENVYFKNDFIFTEPFGTVEIPETGNVVVAAAGKNIKQFVNDLFSVEKMPEVINPVISIDAPQNTLYEIGTLVTPTYKGNLDSIGSYQYGPVTNITVTGWQAIDSNGELLIGQEGIFDPITVTKDTNYTITVQANLSDGAIPVTNLNNPCEEKQFKSMIMSVVSNVLGGYRKSFWGTLNTKEDTLTSNIIRSLSSSSENYLTDGSEFIINIPVEAMRVVIAYPANLRDLSYVLDINDHANIVSGFTKSVIKINGANEDEGVDYKVYIMDFARPYGMINQFKVTI